MKHYMYLLVLLLWFSACEKEEAKKSNDSELKAFSIKELSQSFSISEDLSVTTLVEDGTDLSELTAQFSTHEDAKVFIGNTIQASGFSKNDFSSPITYTVQAADGSSTKYNVAIETTPKIKAFSIKEIPSVTFSIDDTKITAEVPFGTNLNELTAIFEISSNAKLFINGIEQISGSTKNDFTNSVSYTIQSLTGFEDTYTININVAENKPPIANAGEDKLVFASQQTNLQRITLNASASTDPEAQALNFEWSKNGEVLSTERIAEIDLAIGIHTILLKVTDSGNEQATDEITIEVRASGIISPIDTDATQETKNLLKNIASIANSEQFIFGQEFPLSFRLGSLRNDLSTSDCKEVTGDHPGVYGIDPHYMLYKTEQERQLHIDEAIHAYNNGSIVTFDFHQRSRTDRKIYMNEITTQSDKDLMYDVVNDRNGAREWFFDEMDQVLSIINNDLGFPVVFRLFHEMDGNWFWWGSDASNHSSQLYIDFYRLTVNYIKERTQLVLFAWSPNTEVQEQYYPGDSYVDIVGFDIYEPVRDTLKERLIALSVFAANHNKPAILAETGNRNNYIANDPDFWTETILSAIVDGGSEIRIAWVLAWFNAPWHNGQEHLFIPNSNSTEAAKSDFILFKNHDKTLFQQDVKALNVYQ